ncbi:hypothetical protein PPL_08164 [Heterostelium album PN500]|uniref:WAP domain-containing protein n=1 Tax=Heterostelium pallidum (strain ATCC 26659 / Pp 5 / PN500) TaxID=670386 RepID=D3BIS9_HETP5|nr:hypothetical protein PPL_08164 [Heterostelium album PN500]EFA78703.1 hypothetical protein PPL_08164 [Heterostelium album PN500]|eukprot:XP_020430827.1 hypothetical protein PPL_08164 [Heterostelium album PN500]
MNDTVFTEFSIIIFIGFVQCSANLERNCPKYKTNPHMFCFWFDDSECKIDSDCAAQGQLCCSRQCETYCY